MAWNGGLTAPAKGAGAGAQTYNTQCAVCHGSGRAGSPPAFPSLVNINSRLTDEQIAGKIKNGAARMPPFPNIGDDALAALLDYLRSGDSALHADAWQPTAIPSRHLNQFAFTGYRKFLDPDGYPAIAPPWGTLSAIDLVTGKYLWKIPLGEYPELARAGIKNTGSENYGGPIVTAGGILFIGATVYDHRFRAFDIRTGKLLWETELPFAGVATPSTYMVDRRQYVVIAASGGRDPKSAPGAIYIAFALPPAPGS
jgi:quinoprotein glucose dehydrogenase